MNHIKTTSIFAAMVAAIALTAVAVAIPQQALAYGHHHHNHHNHHNNSIKVSQDTSQLNACGQSLCLNNGTNTVHINH
ncbi:MAG TPA: hypothetical protein VFI73_01575 [Candidatus Nitrosopolaris sp.]|nr:hypothetical protein [Candidatus Nitrosopolaris sp.]